MLPSIHRENEPFIPTHQEAILAGESFKILNEYIHSSSKPTIQIVGKDKHKEQLMLPMSALRFLVDVLSEMAKGNAVTLMPVHAELTTQEAADMLNVSRPFLVNLLEENKIPYRMVGSRRRVLAKDIIDYKNKIDQSRLEVLKELSEQAQELNMGYVSRKTIKNTKKYRKSRT